MANPLLRALGFTDFKRAVETVVPRRTFDDVILPPATRRALDQALVQVSSHDLIFRRWGLGERHPTGWRSPSTSRAPGHRQDDLRRGDRARLGRRLLVVRYAEVESMWMGETPKNVVGVFRIARERTPCCSSTRPTRSPRGAQRHSTTRRSARANRVVNVLLQELESFNGVVIFATNMAANFDPAFERRIRTHVLFEMPGVDRARGDLARADASHVHAAGADVDFRALAERYAVSGGDIRNAVLKAALAAATEPVSDAAKRIHQRHFEAGMCEVLGPQGRHASDDSRRQDRTLRQVPIQPRSS